jgi:hypothetical protein
MQLSRHKFGKKIKSSQGNKLHIAAEILQVNGNYLNSIALIKR